MPLPRQSSGDSDSFAGLITPLQHGQAPTAKQRGDHIKALRVLLAPYGRVHEHRLTELLLEQSWDIEAAANHFIHVDLPAIRANHLNNVPNRSPEQQTEEQLLSAPSLHQNHRLAIQQLYFNVQASDPTDQARQITAFRAAILLHRNEWDVRAAQDMHIDRISDPARRAEDKREERRLRLDETDAADSTPNICHRGQRIALMCDFAATDDWVAVRDFLATHEWDLVHLVEVWMRRGLPQAPLAVITQARKAAPAKWRDPILPHKESNNLWPVGRPMAIPLSAARLQKDRADELDAAEDYGQGQYENRTGWLYLWDGEVAKVGLKVGSKRTVRYIIRERGVTEQHPRPIMKGTGGRSADAVPAERQEMDWNRTWHISSVNKWKSQFIRRIPGEVKKDIMPFLKEEEELLFHLHGAELYALQAQGLFHFDSTLDDVDNIPYDLTRITAGFNEVFRPATGGLTVVGGLPCPARKTRTLQSLDMKRRRMPELCATFFIKGVDDADYVEDENEDSDVVD